MKDSGKKTESPKQARSTTETSAKAETTEEKKTRKMLTPEERVAKLEAELAAAREKAQGKDRKAFAQVTEKMTALENKKADIEKQLEELAGQRDAIVSRVPELVNESQTPEL